MANYLAVRLDRTGAAEMSCIAGVGGDVAPLVKTAKSGRPIVALDGCALHCTAHILRRHNLAPALHVNLGEWGVKKRKHEDFSVEEAGALLSRLAEAVALATASVPAAPAAATTSAAAVAVELPTGAASAT